MSEAGGEDRPVSLVGGLRALWEKLFNGPGASEALDELVSAYTNPGRHYHGIRHVNDCFRQWDLCAAELSDARAVAAAIWFHDAVYDATRSDNEQLSAELAGSRLRAMGEAEEFVVKVCGLILDTRHVERPGSRDGEYLLDIDLSILGRRRELFEAYDRTIRREYAHVPIEEYRVGRAKVLRSFLDRPSIYLTERFRRRYERAARRNLARAIAALVQEDDPGATEIG